MEISNLPVSIVRHYAERSPRRKLELTCNVTNSTPWAIFIVDAWVRVETLDGLRLDEGRLFQPFYKRSEPAAIPANENGLGAFHIHLPAKVLQQVEERRAGGDVKLTFSSRVFVCKIPDNSEVMGAPFETAFGDAGFNRFEYLIPQSEWVKVLKALAWSELEILELPIRRFRSVPPLSRALKRFQDAQECYRRGDWEESMLNCRKAFEAIVQDATGESNMRKEDEVLKSIVGEDEKAKRINELAKSLGGFLHLGRHETPPSTSIKRADSELALLITGALLQYLGQCLEQQ